MNGCVVAHQPRAAEAGATVLRRGGNAIDAAVTTAFVQTVIDPMMCGIAGLGVATLFLKTQGNREVGFFERAPLAATPDMYDALDDQPATGGLYWVKDNANQLGYRSVSTPGTLKGLHELLTRFGTIPWAEALAPAIELADEGFQVHEDLHSGWTRKPRDGDVDGMTKLKATAESARIYLNNGQFYPPGERMYLKDYARTLRRIAQEGPDVVYRGELAAEIEADFRANGGILSRKDLAEFEVLHMEPIVGSYRGFTVLACHPPGSGGTVLEMLNILENFDLAGMGLNTAEYIHTVAQAMALAFSDRSATWGDPRFDDIPLQRLLDKEYARSLAEKVRRGEAIAGTIASTPESTTHLSVVDRQGNAVAMTHTLGTTSGVVVPGLGFQFNNFMHRFWPKPGHPNSIAPGKSRVSSLSPTLLVKDGNPVLATGASGGFGIVTGTLQTILNSIDHKLPAMAAVGAPRIHNEGPVLMAEHRIEAGVVDELQRRGHRVQHTPRSYDAFAGIVAMIQVDEHGRAHGGPDPRKGGAAYYDFH